MIHRWTLGPTSLAVLAILIAWTTIASAGTILVPGDFATIQAALDSAGPGDTIEVATGIYNEKVSFPSSGTVGAPIVLEAGANQSPILDGTGVNGAFMVLIDTRSYVEIDGFEIRNNLAVNDGSGIRIEGSGTDIVLRNNVIHEIRGSDAMGITVYGTDPTPIQNLVIDSNEVYDCDPAQSEAITLNGNVTDFEVTNNLVRDVNNIGIDFIGGETDIQANQSLVARNGLVRGNVVIRANSNYGGGYGGGIYVDGGRDIVIENNFVTECDLGIEIGAENPGLLTQGIIVRNNVIYRNEKVGIVFGGYDQSVGRANLNEFRGNTLYQNNTVGNNGQGTYFTGGGIGEIAITFAQNNIVENNIVFAGPENVFIASYDVGGSVDNSFDHNLFFSAGGVSVGEFTLNDDYYEGLAEWRTGTGQDLNSLIGNPLFSDASGGDFHVASGSPAIDAGNPAYVPVTGETDLDGAARLVGVAVDIGADEQAGAVEVIFSDGFESGDPSKWSDIAP